MKLLYIAGPFRGATPWDVECNVRRAEEVGLSIAHRYDGRIAPVIPHTMYRHFDGQITGQYWLDATMALLRRCDGIFMMPGWKGSSGAVAERDEAAGLSLATFHALRDADSGELTTFHPAMHLWCTS